MMGAVVFIDLLFAEEVMHYSVISQKVIATGVCKGDMMPMTGDHALVPTIMNFSRFVGMMYTTLGLVF